MCKQNLPQKPLSDICHVRLKKQISDGFHLLISGFKNTHNGSLLTMGYKLAHYSKQEAQMLKSTWSSGTFHFLIQRSQEKYNLKINKSRRLKLEETLNISFPVLTDQMLRSLYELALKKYKIYCNQNHEHSGFMTTASEAAFRATIESIIKTHSKLKHLEVYPSKNYSKDLLPYSKIVIGNYVPDFIIFGIKYKEYSAIAFEIDGDSHIDKYRKDELRKIHFEELKIFVIEIPNIQANDIGYLTQVLLNAYRLRNGSFNQQILRLKRTIWIKTICCQLPLDEIEDFVQSKIGIQLNLIDEAKGLLSSNNCPRKIKAELKHYRKN